MVVIGIIFHLHFTKDAFIKIHVERKVIRVEAIGSYRNRVRTDKDIRAIAHAPAEVVRGTLKILDDFLLDDDIQVARGKVPQLHVLDELTKAELVVGAFNGLAILVDVTIPFKL